MSDKQQIIDDLNVMSAQVSFQIRTIAIAIIVLVWGGLIGESKILLEFFFGSPRLMFLPGGLALLALIMDYLQYVVGYIHTHNHLRKMEKSGQEDVKYHYRCFTYRLRTSLFWSKQVCLLLSVVALGFFLLYSTTGTR